MTNIVTPQAIKSANAVCTAAKTTLDDATNAVLLLTGEATKGSILYKLTAMARATVTATKCQLYRKDGGNFYLVGSALMAAYTMAQTTVQTPADFGFTESNPLRIPAGQELYVAIGVALAGGVVFDAQYEDLAV